jgi:hypothetical protein
MMKNNPIYKSGQPLVPGKSGALRWIAIMAITATIALMGALLGSGFEVQANTEPVPLIVEDELLVAPAAADNARDLADEVRTTVLCPDQNVDAVCEERSASEDAPVPATGE